MTPDTDYLPASIYTSRVIMGIALVFLFIALITRQAQMSLLILLVLSLVCVTGIWSRMTRGRLRVQARVDRPRIFAGESVSVTVTVTNPTPLPVWFRMDPPQVCDRAESPDLRTGLLLWFQQTDMTWNKEAIRRGCFQLGMPRILTGDPVGFFRHGETPSGTGPVLMVYPRLVPIHFSAIAGTAGQGTAGGPSLFQDPARFLGTQDYQGRTPARHIHWKASARMKRIQEKIFEPAIRKTVLLMIGVDRFCEMQAATDFEITLSVAASLGIRLEKKGAVVYLRTNATIRSASGETTAMTGECRTMPRILEVMAGMEMIPAAPMPCRPAAIPNAREKPDCFVFAHSLDVSARYPGPGNHPLTHVVTVPPHEDIRVTLAPDRVILCQDLLVPL